MDRSGIVGLATQIRVPQRVEEYYSNVSVPQHMDAIGQHSCVSVEQRM